MSMHRPSRRQMLCDALAAGGAGLAAYPNAVFAQELAPTPECRDGDEPTVRQMDGPFYKPQSPERADLVEPGARARLVELSGVVLTRACRPVPRVLVDLWHADEKGDYDNGGFRYRGHVFAPATTTSRSWRPAVSFSPRSFIFRMSRATVVTACSAAIW
jgi:hypothetical protein